MQRLRAVLSDFTKKDNRIIASALFVQETHQPPTILVTTDVNVQLKARAVGLEAEDYLNDKVPEATADDDGYQTLTLNGDVYEMQRFCSEGELEFSPDAVVRLYLNEYVLLMTPEGKTMPGRYYGNNMVRRLHLPDFVKAPGGIPIRPRNLEQQFFMDALMDDSISLVTCFGKAGTGKNASFHRGLVRSSKPPMRNHAMMVFRFPDRLSRWEKISDFFPVRSKRR